MLPQPFHPRLFTNLFRVVRFVLLPLKLLVVALNYRFLMHLTKFGTFYRMLPGFQNQVVLKMPRHAQTQHGDATVDEENIVLLKNILYQPVPTTEPLTCTWFYNVDPSVVPVRRHTTAVNNLELKVGHPEKRKAEDVEQIEALKKARFETKALKAKRPGFSDDRYDETSYYFENGLRKVYPYYFTFTTFTKGRWVGEKILDVFSREFRAHPPEEYKRSILTGSLKVNYEHVPVDYILKHNDLLSNTVHRHEVPVTDQPISIVHMDEDIVVINKPASIPVHPCGRYRHNTVVFILAKEFNLKNLRTIHRLDRLTSGLLLFGRTPKKARLLEQQIRNRDVEKEYVCRVDGNFPDGVVECKEPIEVVSYKIGVCKVSLKGKECSTTFEKIGYNGTTSVLLCKPLTGRMHQIRVHLQYLGYPIVNDPLYNHEVFGPLKGRAGDIGGRTDEELVKDLIHVHNAENWLGIDGDFGSEGLDLPKQDFIANGSTVPETTTNTDLSAAEVINTNNNLTEQTNEGHPNKVTVGTQTGHDPPDFAYNKAKLSVDKDCYECKVRFKDPKPKDLIMYLHAWKYRGPGWQYETQLPDWAGSDWKETTE